MRQRAGSCASQSTQRSAAANRTAAAGRGSVKRRNSGASTATGRVSHGSRHYWDFPKGPGGSVKGGSVVAGAGGGMGSWGEV